MRCKVFKHNGEWIYRFINKKGEVFAGGYHSYKTLEELKAEMREFTEALITDKMRVSVE